MAPSLVDKCGKMVHIAQYVASASVPVPRGTVTLHFNSEFVTCAAPRDAPVKFSSTHRESLVIDSRGTYRSYIQRLYTVWVYSAACMEGICLNCRPLARPLAKYTVVPGFLL